MNAKLPYLIAWGAVLVAMIVMFRAAGAEGCGTSQDGTPIDGGCEGFAQALERAPVVVVESDTAQLPPPTPLPALVRVPAPPPTVLPEPGDACEPFTAEIALPFGLVAVFSWCRAPNGLLRFDGFEIVGGEP